MIVGTDKKSDVTGRNGQKGDQTILVTDNPQNTDELNPLLSESQIYSTYQLPKGTTHFQLYPSSMFPNILYFNFTIDNGNDDDMIGYYGRIDVKTKEFCLFRGKVIGMIEDGSYKGYFLLLDKYDVNICQQSCYITDEENEAEVSFEISDYFEGKNNYDLFDEDFKDSVIEWVEGQ